MLKITRLADYGVVILVEMARNPAESCNPSGLSERLRIPEPTVGKLLKRLTAGGLLRSRRGKNGGYRLRERPETISLARVLSVLEGPLAVTECSVGSGRCQLENDCAVRHNWRQINRAIFQGLDSLSLAVLAQPLAVGAVSLPVSGDQVIQISEPAPIAELARPDPENTMEQSSKKPHLGRISE